MRQLRSIDPFPPELMREVAVEVHVNAKIRNSPMTDDMQTDRAAGTTVCNSPSSSESRGERSSLIHSRLGDLRHERSSLLVRTPRESHPKPGSLLDVGSQSAIGVKCQVCELETTSRARYR